MKTVKLVSISDVKTEKVRTDGKPSRKYYTAYFADAMNPFAKQIQRNFFQDHVGEAGKEVATWKSADPALVKSFIGKEIPGQFINCNVETYKIGERDVNSFTTVLLDGEKLTSVLKQANHVLLVEEVKTPSKIVDETILPISSSTALNRN